MRLSRSLASSGVPRGECSVDTLAPAQSGLSLRQKLRRKAAPFCRGVRTVVRPSLRRVARAFQWLCDEPGPKPDPIHDLHIELQQLRNRVDHLESHLQTTMAFGWDYIAMTRRLAILEDRVETLVQAKESSQAA